MADTSTPSAAEGASTSDPGAITANQTAENSENPNQTTDGFSSDALAGHENADESQKSLDELGIPAKDVLKVNGKDVEMSYDEIKAAAQREIAAQNKLELAKKEIAEARQAKQKLDQVQNYVEKFLDVIKRGDIDQLDDLASNHLQVGDAFKKAVIQYALKEYEYSKMTPEQRRGVDAERELNRLKAEHERMRQIEADRSWQYEVNQWQQHLATELPRAIQQVGLRDTPFIREQILLVWDKALESGQQPTAASVAQYVKQRLGQSGFLDQPTPPQAEPQRRPRATPATVGSPKASEPQGYIPMSEWVKSRGR